MKKVLILILIALGVWYLFFEKNTVEIGPENTTNQGANFKPDPSHASFSGVEGDFSLLERKAYGDLNSDQKNDVVVLLSESGGGSGVFIYVAAYVSGPVNYRGTNAVFLGDRVAPEDLSISNGIVTVKYLDRREDEPFAAEPTIPASKQFMYRNGELVER
jgi:hypothetical protein